MYRKIIPALVVVIGLIACSTTKVYIDYDRDADLTAYSTFAWAGSERPSMEESSPLMHDRTVAYINQKLKAGNLTQVENDPDVFVTYYTDSREEVQLNTTSMGYGYGGGYYRNPYWGGGMGMGMGTSTTRAYTYTRGTLVIDIWDADTKTLVWRGAMEDVVSEDPQKAETLIYKAIDKMVYEWQSMKK